MFAVAHGSALAVTAIFAMFCIHYIAVPGRSMHSGPFIVVDPDRSLLVRRSDIPIMLSRGLDLSPPDVCPQLTIRDVQQ
jgi:hypothetical protein